LGYIVGIFDAVATTGWSAVVAYSTSQPWTGPARPPGLFVFDQREAAAFGQARGFVLDLRRLAYVRVTSDWFPWLDQPDSGIQGRASARWEQRFKRVAEELLTRRPEIIERLGPLWPPGQ
jgi:hypothetical protein